MKIWENEQGEIVRKTFIMLILLLLIVIVTSKHTNLCIKIDAKGLSTSQEVTVNTVDQMIKEDLAIGTIVHTEGYEQVGDMGGATYSIIKADKLVADECMFIKLKNGLMAELVYDSSSIINVASFGIFPDAKISKQLNYMIDCLSYKVNGIQFNEGTYLLDSVVLLDELNYYGNETVLQVADDFITKYDKILTTDESEKELINVGFQSITFSINSKENHTISDREVQLLVLSRVKNCTINDCGFVANAGEYMAVDLLWFKWCENIQKVEIINSYFQNDCGYGTSEEYLKGGCIWFSGLDEESCKFSNIVIDSCIFRTSTSDEILAFWGGKFDNIVVNNCFFTNIYHTSDNFIALNKAYFNDFCFSGCTFNISQNCARVIKLNGLDGSNVDIEDCNFYLNTDSDSPWDNQISVFSCSNSSKKGNVIYDIKRCNIFSTENTVYRAIICTSYTSNVTVNAEDNIFRANVAGGVWWKEKVSDVTVNIKNNK